MSLAVMPAAVLGILAYPFALDRPVWWLMGLAVKGMLAISTWIAGFSQAVVVVPAFGTGALLLLSVALLLAALPISRLRWLAVAPALLGLCLAASPLRQDIYVDRQGAGAAARGPDGRLVALGRPSTFVLEQWLRADGDGRRPADALAAASCDRLGCSVADGEGRVVAFVRDKRAFPEDCSRADILVTARTAPSTCAAGLVIDRDFLASRGAVTIRLTLDGPVVTGSRDADTASRPWRPRIRPPNAPKAADPPAMTPAAAPSMVTESSSSSAGDATDDTEPGGSDTPVERLQ